MNFEYKQLEEKFKTLPRELQNALTSIAISNEIKNIGIQHGLKIDQQGILFDQTSYVILGLMPSREFIKNFSDEAGVDSDTASAIAEDINAQVFGKLKSSMRAFEAGTVQDKNSDISALERVGGFSVEPPANLPAEQNGETDIESKESLISDIENPKPANSGTSMWNPAMSEDHTEAIADHLLSTPTAQPLQKVAQKPEELVKKPGPDSYREPVQ